MNKPKISIIIVSYNTKKLLRDCLNSLFEAGKDMNCEVIIVDNASTDGSVRVAKEFENFLNIKLIVNKVNKGFGGANNQGIKIAGSDLLLLLNSDTIVNKNALERPLSYMKENKNVGVLGCKLVGIDGNVQSSGGYFPNLFNVFFWMTFLDDIKPIYIRIKPYHINPNFENEYIREQDWVTGAYFMIRKKIFDDLGGFDEDYFMYVEEMDYCYRIKSKNWKIIYYPYSDIVHLGGASGTSEDAVISEFKGLMMFFNKHMGGSAFISFLLRFGAFLRMVTYLILGNFKLSKSYAKAWKVI